MRLPYVPDAYVSSHTVRTRVWKADGTFVEPCELLLDPAISQIEHELNLVLSCKLDVVIYADNAHARSALERDIPANMLMTPLQSPARSIVVVQSARADPANGDAERMRRHLTHEFAHVAAALKTGSEKRLGDGNANMRLASWVNEGFACVVSGLLNGRKDKLDQALSVESQLIRNIDTALDDLNGELRSLAFSVATARVWRTVQSHGLRYVFANLDKHEAWPTALR